MHYQDKNISALHENSKKLEKRVAELEAKIVFLENTIATVSSDIQNTKQMIGYLNGRGMGSTVHN
jgi:peptidoglycan hydrolase CwlO-like protein